MKKICIVTGTRAEYGLLKNLMFNLNKEKKIKLYILVTGSHLSKKFGNTYEPYDLIDIHNVVRWVWVNMKE